MSTTNSPTCWNGLHRSQLNFRQIFVYTEVFLVTDLSGFPPDTDLETIFKMEPLVDSLRSRKRTAIPNGSLRRTTAVTQKDNWDDSTPKLTVEPGWYSASVIKYAPPVLRLAIFALVLSMSSDKILASQPMTGMRTANLCCFDNVLFLKGEIVLADINR